MNNHKTDQLLKEMREQNIIQERNLETKIKEDTEKLKNTLKKIKLDMEKISNNNTNINTNTNTNNNPNVNISRSKNNNNHYKYDYINDSGLSSFHNHRINNNISKHPNHNANNNNINHPNNLHTLSTENLINSRENFLQSNRALGNKKHESAKDKDKDKDKDNLHLLEGTSPAKSINDDRFKFSGQHFNSKASLSLSESKNRNEDDSDNDYSNYNLEKKILERRDPDPDEEEANNQNDVDINDINNFSKSGTFKSNNNKEGDDKNYSYNHNNNNTAAGNSQNNFHHHKRNYSEGVSDGIMSTRNNFLNTNGYKSSQRNFDRMSAGEDDNIDNDNDNETHNEIDSSSLQNQTTKRKFYSNENNKNVSNLNVNNSNMNDMFKRDLQEYLSYYENKNMLKLIGSANKKQWVIEFNDTGKSEEDVKRFEESVKISDYNSDGKSNSVINKSEGDSQNRIEDRNNKSYKSRVNSSSKYGGLGLNNLQQTASNNNNNAQRKFHKTDKLIEE
jgi:hypothetical protein